MRYALGPNLGQCCGGTVTLRFELVTARDVPYLAARLDSPRQWPRQHDTDGGLYLCTGLGSRGLTSAALAGELLAAWITGAPFPVEAELRDALDPARQT